MKKYVICLLAVLVAIISSSFTSGTIQSAEVKKKMFAHKWWNFNGGLTDQCDPYYYSPDENNFPDCPPAIGLVYCEIYATPSQWDDQIPDLTTITAYRMKLF
jgi:hypothetical protein